MLSMLCLLRWQMKQKQPKTITLTVEFVKDGIYHRELQTFTLKQYKKMLKQVKKER